MSKYVKELVTDDIRKRLTDVNDALLVNMIGLEANHNYALRKELRAKKVNVLVVKTSLAAKAMVGTKLAGMFDGVGGSGAVCWGGEDIVSLAKIITEILKSEKFPKFEARGGVMDGEKIEADFIAEVAKWPSRTEQLSLLVGQIMGAGGRLSGQLISVGGAARQPDRREIQGCRRRCCGKRCAASGSSAGRRLAAL